MAYNQDIILDLNTNGSYVVVGGKQGDSGRTITAKILQNGEEFDGLTSSTIASYRIRKPNGKATWSTAVVDAVNKTVIIALTSDDLSYPGRCLADIKLDNGSESTSTINFIIDVQVAPNIAEAAIESEQFNYLQKMVDSANNIIESAQAWAEGKRGTEEVIPDNIELTTVTPPEAGTITVDFEKFKANIFPAVAGKKTNYVFQYSNNDWCNVNENYLIVNLNDLGITYTPGNGHPANGDRISIVASIADPAYHNNAKYYSDAIANSQIRNVTTAAPGMPAVVSATYDSANYFAFDFEVPSIKPHASITVHDIPYDQPAAATVSVNDVPDSAGIGELGVLQKSFDFEVSLPSGPRGPAPNIIAASSPSYVNSVPYGTAPSVQLWVTGSEPNYTLEYGFTIPSGPQGSVGLPPSISVGTVTPVEAANASVRISGTPSTGYVIDFDAPRGSQGAPGPTGPMPELGTTYPMAAGSSSAGTSTVAARQDHIHPLQVSDAAPMGLSQQAAPGSLDLYARADHIHQTPVTAFTILLEAEAWNSNVATITDSAFESNGYVYIVSPQPSQFENYTMAQIYADDVTVESQITFYCKNAPSNDLRVNVLKVVSI